MRSETIRDRDRQRSASAGAHSRYCDGRPVPYVVFINGGQGGNTFWQVGSSATLGTTTEFTGNILALTSITLNTNANINCGRALARNGAVTMDDNNVFINTPGCETIGATQPVPEPSTFLLLATGVIGTAGLLRRKVISFRQS